MVIISQEGWRIPGGVDYMAKTTLEAVDLITNLINAGSLVDPISSSRHGDFAFSDELRLSGQFPKVYITAGDQPDDTDYTFGRLPEYVMTPKIEIYFYAKLSKENIYTDSSGSYKNERLVMRYQQLIRELMTSGDTIDKLSAIGFHKVRVMATSEIIPLKERGLFAGMLSFSLTSRYNN